MPMIFYVRSRNASPLEITRAQLEAMADTMNGLGMDVVAKANGSHPATAMLHGRKIPPRRNIPRGGTTTSCLMLV